MQKNLVKREVCLDNRRKIELSITQKGLDLLVRLDPLISNEEEKLTQSLTINEKKQLLGLLEKINVNHEKSWFMIIKIDSHKLIIVRG